MTAIPVFSGARQRGVLASSTPHCGQVGPHLDLVAGPVQVFNGLREGGLCRSALVATWSPLRCRFPNSLNPHNIGKGEIKGGEGQRLWTLAPIYTILLLMTTKAIMRHDYTAPQAARILGCSPNTVKALVGQGKIRAYRIPSPIGGEGRLRIPFAELDRVRNEWIVSPDVSTSI